jgi:DNA polymerase (family X)
MRLVRRGCELVGVLEFVGILKTKSTEIVEPSPNLRLYLTPCEKRGIALLFATGSEAHVQKLAKVAASKNLTLSPAGLLKKKRVIASPSEEDIYRALGLAFVAPELREGNDEIELAAVGQLPKLVDDDELKGILHAHTERSDGVNTLEEMVKATRARGYEYFGVADHSRSAHYAGGLRLEELAEQEVEARALDAKYGPKFKIFSGIESDILPDGSLDYPDEILARFDFLVASIHSRFNLDRDTQTKRLLRAVENPYTTILGHMTGRQLLRRPGYEIEVNEVLKACGQHGVAVEINANPWRLDLDWR